MSDPTTGMGYDVDFLGTAIAVPAAPGLSGSPAELGQPLDYVHFSLRMHPTRRLAWWVAWNVDGLRLFPSDSISRSGERFKLDPRIPDTAQTGEEVYADNDLDRGHIARRSDLLWGTLAEARQANSDSFTYSNIRRSTRTSTSPEGAECGVCSRTPSWRSTG